MSFPDNFITALSLAKLPVNTPIWLPGFAYGFSNDFKTSCTGISVKLGTSSKFSLTVFPVTVNTSSCKNPPRESSFITNGTPPMSFKSDI